MVDELSDRIDDWLPGDLTGRDEIRAAIDGTGWFQNHQGTHVDAVVDNLDTRRDPQVGRFERQEARQTTVMGPQDDRRAVVRDAEGKVAGSRDNIKTWEDRWGNTMYHNSETGQRGKLRDANE